MIRFKGLAKLIYVILLPLVFVLTIETIHRGSVISFFEWVLLYTREFSVKYLLLFGIVNAFLIFGRRIYVNINLILLGFFLFFTYASNVKTSYQGEPILPSDIKLASEAKDISKYLTDGFSLKMALFIVGFIIFAILVNKFSKKIKYGFVTSLVISVLSVLIVVSVYSDKPYPIKKTFQIDTINWDQGLNYSQNGMLLGFILNSRYMFVDIPENYNKEEIENITKSVKRRTNINKRVKPNIIFILSEAFWDPTVMEGLNFSEDPIPYFHSLQEKTTTGTLLVPVFGGGTVNTEFEILTGFSAQFIPKGTIAYSNYINKPMNSLASILAKEGYKSTVVHTYHNWFYRRNHVLKNLGFDNFISYEFFNDPKTVGYYVEDNEVMDRVLDELNSNDNPQFVFAITMQGHGPYYKDTYPERTIQVDGDISQEAKDIIETYAMTISDVDKSLERLISQLEKVKHPTIVVFFGDHLPVLGNDFMVYKETGYFKDTRDYEDYLKAYSVPFIIWNNYSIKKEELKISSSFLMPYVLNMAKRQGTVFTDYLYSLYKKGESIIPRDEFYKDGNIDETKLNEYKLLQYDLMFGDGYGLKKGEHPLVKDDYILGSRKMILKEVTPNTIDKSNFVQEDNMGVKIGIHGENFVKNSIVFINGKPADTKYQNPEYLKANIPQNLYRKTGFLEIKVKVIDSLKNVIVETNALRVEMSDVADVRE